MPLHTITKQELVDILADLPDDARLAFATDYGDRSHTQQVHAIEGSVEERDIGESGYSDSGWAVLDDEDDDAQDVGGDSLWIIS